MNCWIMSCFSSVPTLICIDRLAQLFLLSLSHYTYPQALMYQNLIHSLTHHHNANLTTDCAMHIAKDFGRLKATFMFQKQQTLISMHVLIDSSWIFSMWYELWREKLWYFDLIWATVLLTVVWPRYCKRRKWFDQNTGLNSYLWLIFLFSFWSFSISLFHYLSFLFFFLFLFDITRNVYERLLCQLAQHNRLVMMRKSIHLSLRSVGLDRLLDPPTPIHCSECHTLIAPLWGTCKTN